MGTLQRIKEYIDFKGITNRKFEQEVGFSNGAFASQLKNKKTIGVDKLENILIKYPEVNPEWLLTGIGTMLKEGFFNVAGINEPPTIYKTTAKKEIPLIPMDAMAVFCNDSTQLNDDTEKYVVPEFTELKTDFMIRVKGSDMYPKYNNGDIVACKKLPLDTFFQWNKVYVLDTVQGAMIKRVHQSYRDGFITCVSDNEKYKPFDLSLNDVYGLALVIGEIKLE